MWELKIPAFPVSVNSCFEQGRKFGTRRKSKHYLEWEFIVEKAMCEAEEMPQYLGSLSMEIELHAPDWFTKKGSARKKDLDNFAKTVIDSIFKHLILDDKWVFSLKMDKVNSNGFYTVVRIFPLHETSVR